MAIRDLPIRRKITWAMMAVSLTALLLACVALLAYDLVTYRDATVRNLSTLAQILGFNSAAALLFNDPASATTTLAALKAQPHVISAGIYTRDGQQFATYLRATSSSAAPPPRLLPDQAEAHVFEAR